MDKRPSFLADDERFYAPEVDNVGGDSLTASADSQRGEIHIEIEEPWAGSTETGFGAICGMTLKREQAVALANWILKVAK